METNKVIQMNKNNNYNNIVNDNEPKGGECGNKEYKRIFGFLNI